MKNLLPFFVIILFPLTLLADEPLWKKFVQEETVIIAHIDLSKIEPAAVIQNNSSLIKSVADMCPPNTIPDAKTLTSLAEMQKKYLTETLGIQEAYVMCNLYVPSFITIIVPQTDKSNVQTIRSALALFKWDEALDIFEHKETNCILLSYRHPGRKMTEEERSARLAQIVPQTPTDRPDFAEAFTEVDNAPIKIVSAIPGFAKRVVKEMPPKLPDPFGEIDIITPLTELRWKAVGIDPATPAINVTATMTTESAAAETLDNLKKVSAIYFDAVASELDTFVSNTTEQEEIEKWEMIKTAFVQLRDRMDVLLFPQLQKNKLTLRLGQSQFEEMLAIFSPLIKEQMKDE